MRRNAAAGCGGMRRNSAECGGMRLNAAECGGMLRAHAGFTHTQSSHARSLRTRAGFGRTQASDARRLRTQASGARMPRVCRRLAHLSPRRSPAGAPYVRRRSCKKRKAPTPDTGHIVNPPAPCLPSSRGRFPRRRSRRGGQRVPSLHGAPGLWPSPGCQREAAVRGRGGGCGRASFGGRVGRSSGGDVGLGATS